MSAASATRVTRWFAPVDQRGVVQPTVGLGDEEGLAAHLEDQGLGNGAVRRVAGDAEGGADQPVGVLGRTGEGHGRVQGERQHPGQLRGREDGHAVRAGGVEGRAGRRARRRSRRGRRPGRGGCRPGPRGRRGRRRRPPRRWAAAGRRAAGGRPARRRRRRGPRRRPRRGRRRRGRRPGRRRPVRRPRCPRGGGRGQRRRASGRQRAGSCGKQASVQPLVPVPGGYRTSGVAHTVGGHGPCWCVLWCLLCGGTALLQPDVSRSSTAGGECGPGSRRPQRAAACGIPHRGPPSPRNGVPGAPLPWAPDTSAEDGSTAWARWMDGPPW